MSITSGFGSRIQPVIGGHDFHKGIDLVAIDEPVFSILPGEVIQTGFNSILGNYVKISHAGQLESIYGHLCLCLVEKGSQVNAGSIIAVSGSTGRVTAKHLHFSLKLGKNYINPIDFFKAYFQ